MEYYVSQGGFNFDRISPVYLLAQSQFFIDLSSLINSTDSRQVRLIGYFFIQHLIMFV